MNEWQNLSRGWSTFLDLAMTYGMKILAAAGLLLIGYIVARLLEKVLATVVKKSGLETLLERLDLAKFLYRIGIHSGFGVALGRLTRYLVIAISIFVAVDVAGIEAFSSFRDQFFAFIPRGLTGVALVILGLFLAELAHNFTVATLTSTELFDSPELMGKLVQVLVIVLTLTTAGDHVGLEIQMVRQVLLLAIAAAGLALAIGVGLGGRIILRNLLTRAYVEQAIPIGSRVVFGEDNLGTLKEFAAQSAVFEDEDGHETWVPYSEFVARQFRVLESSPIA